MSASASELSVVLEPVVGEKSEVLANLIQLYAYDFSEYVHLELNERGQFDVPLEDIWWSRDDHHAFFFRVEGKLVGFALVSRGSRVNDATSGAQVTDATSGAQVTDVMDVAEFFVIRSARRKAIGTIAAHALFAKFPGRWEIRVREANAVALAFWTRTAASWSKRPIPSGRTFTAKGVTWTLLSVPAA